MAEVATTLAGPRHLLDRVPGLRQLVLLVAIAGSVAIGVAVVLWSHSPDYRPLYHDLEERDMAEVAAALEAAGIPHRLDSRARRVSVPASRVDEAVMELAERDLPQGPTFGWSMLAEKTGITTSDFREKAQHHHVLETELERTIASLKAVQSARVHLAMQSPSPFVRRRKPGGASVVLRLYAGRHLEPARVLAIQNLVASSIPDLEASRVTVVDQDSNLLSLPPDSSEMVQTARRAEYRREIESEYEQDIVSLLEPMVGLGRVRATVAADIDFEKAEEASTSFDPNTRVRSEVVNEERRTSDLLSQGVPGALTNQPPEGPGATSEETGEGSESQQPTSTSTHRQTNYEMGTTIQHRVTPSGGIRRLSVAVVVDDKPGEDGSGEGEQQALTDEELAEFTVLVQHSVGFDEARGDTVSVVNASFQRPPPPEPGPEPQLWERPLVRDLLRQGVGALLVLVLALTIVRPVMRNLLKPTAMPLLGVGGAPGGLGDLAPDRTSLGAHMAPGQVGPVPLDQQMTTARTLVGQDPRRVAQVVRNWVGNDG